jgi:hypothetical protein
MSSTKSNNSNTPNNGSNSNLAQYQIKSIELNNNIYATRNIKDIVQALDNGLYAMISTNDFAMLSPIERQNYVFHFMGLMDFFKKLQKIHQQTHRQQYDGIEPVEGVTPDTSGLEIIDLVNDLFHSCNLSGWFEPLELGLQGQADPNGFVDEDDREAVEEIKSALTGFRELHMLTYPDWYKDGKRD